MTRFYCYTFALKNPLFGKIRGNDFVQLQQVFTDLKPKALSSPLKAGLLSLRHAELDERGLGTSSLKVVCRHPRGGCDELGV